LSHSLADLTEKGTDANKVVILELPSEQQEDLSDIASFIRQQNNLKHNAQTGILTDQENKLLKRVELAMEKYFKLLKEIRKLNEENSSWIE
jgi:hypothetical protein